MTTYAGWQLEVYVRSGSAAYIKLNGIQRVTYRLVEGTEAKEECGTRYSTLVEGNYGLTCSIERFYTGSGPWNWFTKGEAALDYYDVDIWPNRSGSAKDFIRLGGLKPMSTSPSHRPSANLMTESWEFIGTGSVTTGTGT